MSTQFITNKKGKKISVIIPIKEYEEMLEDLYSRKVLEERRNDERISLEELKNRLIADGILPS